VRAMVVEKRGCDYSKAEALTPALSQRERE
jgi:hypothetical protein